MGLKEENFNKIIEFLKNNSNKGYTYVELTREVKVSEGAVKSTIRVLKKEGRVKRLPTSEGVYFAWVEKKHGNEKKGIPNSNEAKEKGESRKQPENDIGISNSE